MFLYAWKSFCICWIYRFNRRILKEKTTKTFNDFWPRDYKIFFMLNSAEHEIFPANNMKMPTIVDIFIFISREIFMLSYV